MKYLLFFITLIASSFSFAGELTGQPGWYWTSKSWNHVQNYACNEVYYLVRKCADVGGAVLDCRPGKGSSPNGGFVTEFKCGEAPGVVNKATVPGCEKFYTGSYGGAGVCGMDEGSEWNHAKTCLPEDELSIRRRSCPRGCVRKGNSYPVNASYPHTIHLWDWSNQERRDFRGCISSPMAFAVYSAAQCGRNVKKADCKQEALADGKLMVPVGNPDPNDVDHDKGNIPRLRVYSHTHLTDLEGKRHIAAGSSRHKLKIDLMSIRGHKASYCIFKEGESCVLRDFSTIRTSGHKAHPKGEINLENYNSGLYNIKVKNDSTGREISAKFSILNKNDFGGQGCRAGMWQDVTGTPQFSNPDSMPSTGKPSSHYSGQACPCLSSSSVKDSEDRLWVCKEASNTPAAQDRCLYYHDPNGDSAQRQSLYLATNESAKRIIQMSRSNRTQECTRSDGTKGEVISVKWIEQNIYCKPDGSIGSISGSGRSNSGYIEVSNSCVNTPTPEIVADNAASEPVVVNSGGGENIGSPQGSGNTEEASSSPKCVYYDWVGGKSPHIEKPLNANETLTQGRGLPHKIEKISCPSGSGFIVKTYYIKQVIKCGPNGDTGAVGSGLTAISSERIDISSENLCQTSAEELTQ